MKKFTTLAFLFLLGFSVAGHAQLGKLKGKASSISNKAKSTKNKASSSDAGKAAKEAQTILRMEGEADEFIAQLEAIYSDPAVLTATSDDDLEKPLFNLKQKVSTLNNYYPMSQRKGELTATCEEYKTKFKEEMDIRENMSSVRYELKSDAEWVTKLKESFNHKSMMGGYGPTLERYNGNKNAYKGTGKEYADLDGYITILDEHFNKTYPSFATPLRDYLIKERLSNAFSEENWKGTPKTCIKNINYQLEDFEELYSRAVDAAWVDGIKKELEVRKGELQTYIDSGAFDTYMKEEYQKKVDARRMDKPGKNDASLIAIIKKNHNEGEYGAIKRAIITGNDWSVEKNSWGLPIEKFIRVQVVTTKDGVCDIRNGRLFKEYEGGGTYGSIKLSHYGFAGEINCANVNK